MLSRVLRESGLPAVWSEWSTDDPGCPEEYRSFGSPTILVNGRDVAPGPHPWVRSEGTEGPRIRRYGAGAGGTAGVPPSDRLRGAIEQAVGPEAG